MDSSLPRRNGSSKKARHSVPDLVVHSVRLFPPCRAAADYRFILYQSALKLQYLFRFLKGEKRIRELRKRLGLRQEDLADKLGVTRQTINAIENEKYNPSLELAMKLARLLQTPVEELFHLEI